jgi:rubrerythrin
VTILKILLKVISSNSFQAKLQKRDNMEFVHPFPGKNPGDEISETELISALRLALCAEEEATHLYDTIAEYAKDLRVKEIMEDIASEEQVHIGEIQTLLDLFDDNEEEKLKEGGEEAEEKMESISPSDIAKFISD